MRQSLLGLPRRARQNRHTRKVPPPSRPAALAERIERAHVLDPVIHELSDSVVRALPAGARTDALHGVPFSHPALVRLPLGLLDLGGPARGVPRHPARVGTAHRGRDRGHRARGGHRAGRLVGAAPGPAAGRPGARPLPDRRGHAVSRLAGGPVGGQASYGPLLSASGLAVATIGSYLGSHLALRLGAGTSHAEQVSHLAGLGWHDLCDVGYLPDRRPVRRQLGYLSLLVYRAGSEVSVLSDRCSHLGGPLHQGRIVVERGLSCVACPWHGSNFRRCRRHRRARTRYRPSAILRDPRDRQRPGRTQAQALTRPGLIRPGWIRPGWIRPGWIRTRSVRRTGWLRR